MDGAAALAQYAFAPTLGTALNLTLLSYNRICALGVNVDRSAIPDVEVLRDCLIAGFDEVLALAPGLLHRGDLWQDRQGLCALPMLSAHMVSSTPLTHERSTEMVISAGSQLRTRNFARVIGPFLAVIAVIAVARSAAMTAMLEQFTTGEVWSWVVGAFVLAGGIAIVAFHQYWRTPAAVIVSVIGWLFIIRGLFLMAFPTVFASMADRVVGSADSWRWLYVVLALIGLYLTYVGWKPLSRADADRTAGESGKHEVRRAA